MDAVTNRLHLPREHALMTFHQLMHDSDRNPAREAYFAIQVGIDIRESGVAGDCAAHLAVRIATIRAVAIKMNGPIFGQSVFHCVPTRLMRRI